MSNDQLNHHNDPSGLLRSLRAGGEKQSLGDLAVVDKILRKFASDILVRFEHVGHGLLTPEDAASADRADCERLAAVFAGADETYAPVPGWTGYGLAQALRNSMKASIHPDEDDKAVIAQAFAVFVHQVYTLIRDTSEDADETALLEGITESVRSFSWLLIGLEGGDV